MKVFTDINFLVSAFATHGLSSEVFQMILSQHELLTSEVVLKELRQILVKELKLPHTVITEIEQFLRKYPVEPYPSRPAIINIRDQDDRWVLASAINAKSEVLITGDRNFLEVAGKVNKLRILTPRQFWELIQE